MQKGDRVLGEGAIALWFEDTIAYTGISNSSDAMTQSNDLSQRVDRTEGQIIDLQMTASLILQAIDKNSEDITALLEVTRRNSEAIVSLREGTTALQLAQMRTEAALQVFQQHTDEAIQDIRTSIATLTASNERMDQLLEYVIRRDQGQLE